MKAPKVKDWQAVAFLTGLICVWSLAYFSKYPLFPSTDSVDFIQHLNLASSVARGELPPLQSILLYGAVEYYLALFIKVLSVPAIAAVRYGMALLVVASVPMFYVCVKEVMQDRKAALWGSVVYALSGSVWFGMVFNSGLYPNFYGLMFASLPLAAATSHFVRKGCSLQGIALLVLATANALVGHYSDLMVWPPLLLWLGLTAWRQSKLRKGCVVAASVLSAPILAGAAVFPALVSTLTGLASGSGGNVPPPTFLSSLIPLPTASFMVSEVSIGFPWGDLGAALLLGLGAWGVWKGRNTLVSSWFLLVLLFPAYSSIAWRYAFVGLLPLTVLAGWSLSKLKPRPFFPDAKALGFIFLLIAPSFFSFGTLSFNQATSNAQYTAQQQGADWQALQWMKTHQDCNYNSTNHFYDMTIRYNYSLPVTIQRQCGYLSVSDWNFNVSPYIGGPQVVYGADSSFIITDPLQMQLFAGHNGAELIVTTLESTVGFAPCNPNFAFGLSMTASSTSVKVGQLLYLNLTSAVRGLNASVNVYDNRTLAEQVGLVDSRAVLKAQFDKPGVHDLMLTLGSTATTDLIVKVVSYDMPTTPSTVYVPADYCIPFYKFNAESMGGWSLVYSTQNVRIWKVDY